MLITNHVLAGALIGRRSSTPATAFVAGVVSHFVLDAIPHWGARSRRHFLTVAVVDGLVGATTLAVVASRTPRQDRSRVVAGMLGAAFPDADKPADLVVGRSPFPARVDDFHARIQRESPHRLAQEFVVAVALGSLNAVASRYAAARTR